MASNTGEKEALNIHDDHSSSLEDELLKSDDENHTSKDNSAAGPCPTVNYPVDMDISSDVVKDVKSSDKQPKIKVKSAKSAYTGFLIGQAAGVDKCEVCSFQGDAQEVAKHVRQHFTRFFCPCSHSEPTKYMIIRHVKNMADEFHAKVSTCYEVDKSNFTNFLRSERLPLNTQFGRLYGEQQTSFVPTVPKPVIAPIIANPCQDIRLTQSASQIKEDADKIRAERESMKPKYDLRAFLKNKKEPDWATQPTAYPKNSNSERRSHNSSRQPDTQETNRRGSHQPSRSQQYSRQESAKPYADSRQSSSKTENTRTSVGRTEMEEKLTRVMEERDTLRRQNELMSRQKDVLQVKYEESQKVIRRMKKHLDQLAGMQQHLTQAQALADCHLG